MLRLGEIHKNIYGGDENIIERIAILYLNYNIYHKEQIETGKLKLRDLFIEKYQENIAIKYLSNENINSEITWDDRWRKLIVIELDSYYELENIYLISADKIRASKNKVSLFLAPVILEQYAKVYNKNEFIDLEEKYIKKFRDL
jgi:hypothetical protein